MSGARSKWRITGVVNGLIYLIGLIVVILFILSFLGLRWTSPLGKGQ
jgi:hypothetical protein